MQSPYLNPERVERVLKALPLLMGGCPDSHRHDISNEELASALPDVLADYFRAMEIAHYVRRGGIKAMIYRIETGRVQFAPMDYFDEANAQLSAAYRESESPSPQSVSQLLEKLTAISADEEEAVSAALPKLDQLLLALRRQYIKATDGV